MDRDPPMTMNGTCASRGLPQGVVRGVRGQLLQHGRQYGTGRFLPRRTPGLWHNGPMQEGKQFIEPTAFGAAERTSTSARIFTST